ncbi:ABC Fe3+ siderophore transporter, inner membrane subunit (plasmid) [Neorhizobium galegae bv. officinalis bv. officinalis str. HAMBI 1141]|uniref:ABC Fe3+ siderophore transporter, inner membrane subunit n=1 Tax=Neorhizobium galegae bv. officinalis bv. officinalis str. HAMBI 1141 TaxID=1028801 RepID=A0A068TFK5_NEOGA|nr:iron ABC transporter permease [Neorhizobium galegae]CDN56851.1 ABC Fe3+ siderophore transporter, inner membrane subunit [Neorhizobium galegae bv. officinalis bv. officinalis str. HAMBI 1141]
MTSVSHPIATTWSDDQPVKVRVPWHQRLQPANLLWLFLAGILVVLIVAPMWTLVVSSFTDAKTGGWTLHNYVEAYGKERHITALTNTLKMGAVVVVLKLAFGVPLAWACTRTDMPGRNFVRYSVFGAFIMPPYLAGVGWILLAGPNTGWINRVWHSLSGSTEPLVNIFSFGGLVLVTAIGGFFLVFVLVSSAFEMINSEMEDAANILGAGPFKTAMKVTFPLVMPAIIGAALLSFLGAIALYGVPALISIPARYPVVVIQLTEFFSFPLRIQVAAAYSIPLLLITAVMLGLQKLILRRKGYVSVSGKGGERRIVKLGRWRWVLFGYCFCVVALSVLMPMFVLLLAAFSDSWTAGFSFSNLTLSNFHYVLFEHSSSQKALVGSIGLGIVAATVAITLALFIAYIVQRKLIPFSGLLAFLAVSPYVVPGIVLAIGFYAAYALPPIALYGTYTIMALAFVTRFLPIAFTTSSAGVRSIHPEMEEAVRILGGGRVTALRHVVGPLLKRTLAGGWLLIFVPAAQELSTAIFLVGPTTRVVSVVLLDLSEEGELEKLAALGSLLLIIIVAVVAIGMRYLGRDFMLRRS